MRFNMCRSASNLAMQRLYRLCGVTIGVRSDHPAVAERVFALMDYFGLDGEDPSPVDAEVNLDLVAGGFPMPSAQGCPRPVEPMGIRVWTGDPELYVEDGSSWVRVDCSRATAQGFLRPPEHEEPSFNLNLVTYSLLTLLRFRGFFPLHAAGVALGGVSCLFVGDSGCGKSTLAASLLREGWGFLSDDSLMLCASAAGVEARPLRSDLFLDVDNGRPPKVVGAWEPCLLAEPAKKRLKVRELYPDRFLPSCVPSLLVFPQVTSNRQSRVEPYPRAEALHVLAHESLLLEMERLMAPAHLGVLRDLVTQCDCFQLLAGADLVDNSPGVAALVGRICNESKRRSPLP